MKSKAIVASMLFASQFCIANLASALGDKQQGELYRKGIITITDELGQVEGYFEVKFMPGSENIEKDAKEAQEEAGKLLKDLIEGETFWKDKVYRRFCDGLEYTKECVYEKGICAIPGDFSNTCEENANLHDSFGAPAAKVKNWIKFSGRSIGRFLGSLWGIGAGTVYAVMAPVATIVSRPLGSLACGTIGGAVWPMMKFAWNGAAWVAVKGSSEPKPGDMTVTWHPQSCRP